MFHEVLRFGVGVDKGLGLFRTEGRIVYYEMKTKIKSEHRVYTTRTGYVYFPFTLHGKCKIAAPCRFSAFYESTRGMQHGKHTPGVLFFGTENGAVFWYSGSAMRLFTDGQRDRQQYTHNRAVVMVYFL